jgi:hypothetical protein
MPRLETLLGFLILVDLYKGFKASLCNHILELWYCAWLAQCGRVQSSSNFYVTCG